MSACVCECVSACVYMRVFVCLRAGVCACVCAYARVCVCACMRSLVKATRTHNNWNKNTMCVTMLTFFHPTKCNYPA